MGTHAAEFLIDQIHLALLNKDYEGYRRYMNLLRNEHRATYLSIKAMLDRRGFSQFEHFGTQVSDMSLLDTLNLSSWQADVLRNYVFEDVVHWSTTRADYVCA